MWRKLHSLENLKEGGECMCIVLIISFVIGGLLGDVLFYTIFKNETKTTTININIRRKGEL